MLNYCEFFNISNTKFPPNGKDIEQIEKDNPNISVLIFEYGGFEKIDANYDDGDDDDNDDDDKNNKAFTNIKNYDDTELSSINIDININNRTRKNTKKFKREYGIKINDVRISPYATQRKHLVELLIIKDGENKHFLTIKNISRLLIESKYDFEMYYCKKCYCSFKSTEILENIHTPLCTDIEKALTVMPEKDKNDTVKFKDYHMQIMQPFMIVADFETFKNNFKELEASSFAMFTHCIFNEEKNNLTYYTGDNCLDNFFKNLITDVHNIDKSNAKSNPHTNPDVHKSNPKYPIV